MATVDQVLILPRPHRRAVAPSTLFVGFFVALPLSWFLGLAAFFWPAVAFVLALRFLIQRRLTFPRRFGIWLLLVAWIPLSATEADSIGALFVFAQRYLNIVAATIVFLYVFNVSRSLLPDRTVVDALAVYWGILVVGGAVAVVAPGFAYHTPVEALLPGGLAGNAYVHATLHVQLADIHNILGVPTGRPSVFFTATNAWGAMIALLTPFALGAIAQARHRSHRRLLQVLLVLSIVPIVVSLNRGLWIALAVIAAYIAIRTAVRRDLRSLAWLLGMVSVVGALLFATPLGGFVQERLATPHSNEGREILYQEAIARIEASPFLGAGGPRPSERNPDGPPVGTHSQLLFVAFSYGLPALVLLLGWLGLTFVRSLREASGPAFWAHVSILAYFVQAPYYLLEAHLVVVLIAAALVWRRVAFGRSPDAGAPATS